MFVTALSFMFKLVIIILSALVFVLALVMYRPRAHTPDALGNPGAQRMEVQCGI